ncbi:L-threonine aldolase [Litoreibacter ponti]|uniref:L-threonine aldolase n=1 Tax=Litoreibacter ponti TaxID=1510457 RepID=A0A2T6BLN8_9RHOB|nr:low specificity L-threonine aldolase [Litoreibacter ponti]PTX56994.1 L-threonine aldolase [Litoreibacter ponti]
MFFASDNTSPVHPKVMEAVVRANTGYAMPYGNDPIMDEVRAAIRDRFEAPEAAVYLTATGTSANCTALACLAPPWSTIFCHTNAHIEEDECGAPEFYTGGAKLTLVGGDDARMDANALDHAISHTGRGGVHNIQCGAVSLTSPTENGAVYSVAQIEEIALIAKRYDLPLHMDGARFANALVATNASPAEMTWKAGVDAVTLGGTKNGLMGVEAVILFDAKHAWEFELRRKRAGHLFSKHRYLSAQMQTYLDGDLWLEMARHANAMAARLKDGLMQLEGAELLHPVEANSVFARWPRAAHKRAHDAGAKYYLWPFAQPLDGDPEELLSARMVCSWCTTEDDVDQFLSTLTP